MENMSFKILEEKKKFPDIPIIDLYGKNMPISLQKIHVENDDLVSEIFFKENLSDEDMVRLLFSNFENCIKAESKKLF